MPVRRASAVVAPSGAGGSDLESEMEARRQELTGYCYRMLGSGFEAEDAVQETMVRAWKAYDRFEGRSSLRSWLYRIATNVCLDMLRGPQRRARPMDMGPSVSAEGDLGVPLPERAWVQPIADARVLPSDGDPAELAAGRESIRLAFVAALQLLPPRQRAVLVLREVLHWSASEVGELLDTTVASVNSALQRARATLANVDLDAPAPDPTEPAQQELLARYMQAFEAYDIESLVSLLRDDAAMTMPPFTLWLRGTADISRWYVGQGKGCEGSRLLPIWANGRPGFGAYKPSPSGRREPFAIQIIDTDGDQIVGLHHFLYPELFAAFGLPDHLD